MEDWESVVKHLDFFKEVMIYRGRKFNEDVYRELFNDIMSLEDDLISKDKMIDEAQHLSRHLDFTALHKAIDNLDSTIENIEDVLKMKTKAEIIQELKWVKGHAEVTYKDFMKVAEYLQKFDTDLDHALEG